MICLYSDWSLASNASLHLLRHAAITWLLESGLQRGDFRPEDIALMCWGHRSTALLYGLYGHADREAAADRLKGVG